MAAARAKKLLIGGMLCVSVILAVGGYLVYAPRRVPGGQAGLVHLDAGNIGALRADFNAAQGTRLVVVLSPT